MKKLINDIICEMAEKHPDREAIAYGERRISYRALVEQSTSVARKIVARGVMPGDRVALVSENSAEFLVACLAVWKSGGILALIFPSFGPVELDYAFRNSEPKIALVEEERLATVASVLDNIGSTVDVLPISDGDLLSGFPPATAELPAIDPATTAIICYTSGTSGHPKPVSHSHGGLAIGVSTYVKSWRISEKDVSLCALPLAWTAGLYVASFTALCAGAAVIIMRRFKPGAALDTMQSENVTFFFGVTTMYVKLVSELNRRKSSPSLKLRCCFSGGEPRNEAANTEWKRYTGMEVFDCWSATESWPLVTYDLSVDRAPRLGSAGRLLECSQLRLIGPDGAIVAPGEVGEAESRAPVMMVPGYWNEPELTSEALTKDGWYRMKDYVRIDEDGYVYIVGRSSDMIIRGGINISPIEIEAVISEHESVLEVAVVGTKDETFGQMVTAAIVTAPNSNFNAEALASLCRERLAHYKVPELILEIDEMPHNASGKVLRRAVVPMIQELQKIA